MELTGHTTTESEQQSRAMQMARRAVAFAGLSASLITPHAEAAPQYTYTEQVTVGENTNAVILADLPDATVPPMTAAEAQTAIFDGPQSTHNIFADESFGKLQFKSVYADGNVYGPVAVNTALNKKCSNYRSVARAAYAAAQASTAKDLAAYNNYTIILPEQKRCKYNGISVGNIALTNTTAPYVSTVAVHELGHNLGLGHARSQDCKEADGTPAVNKGKCQKNEYGDEGDYMGGTESYYYGKNFSAYEKARLGWTSLATVRKDGAVTIPAIDVASDQPHGVRIPVGKEAGKTKYLYADYRGVRNIFPDAYGITPTRGVTVRTEEGLVDGNGAYLPSTLIYDAKPVTVSTADAAIARGKSLTTAEGIRFKVTSADDNQATVRITGIK